MAVSKHDVEPYGFTVEFERALAALLCTRSRFFGRIGKDLDAEGMTSPQAKLAVAAAQEIAKDTGQGPNSVLVLLQRLRRHHEEGAATRAEIDAVDDYIADAEDEGLPTEEEALAELVPIVKRRIQLDAIRLAHSEFGKRRDMDRVLGLLNRAEGLGKNDSSLGLKVGSASFELISALRHLERCPIGIDDLDTELRGGPPRGTLTMFMGAAGEGKSMALSHVAAHGTRLGLFFAYATLELPVATVHARIIANHTGLTIDEVQEYPARAQGKLAEDPPAGLCYVKEFTPQVTTVGDIAAWVLECEEAEGRPLDGLVVDYADKLTANIKETGSYRVMEHVYEELRTVVHEGRKWGFTASQSRRGDGKKKTKDLDDAADSQNKVRVVDLCITLNLDEEDMTFGIAKYRHGRARQSVGPLPADFACGAVGPVSATYGTAGALANETSRALDDVLEGQ